MNVPAFLGAAPLHLRALRPALSNRRAPLHTETPKPTPRRKITPTCGLSKDLATAAAAAVTLSLSCLPIRPRVTDAAPHPTLHHPVVVVNATHSKSVSNPLAVVGVGKAAIHDYAPGLHRHDPDTVPRSVSHVAHTHSHPIHHDLADFDHDEARREFALAVRLVTAVLLGVMLGVERRATSLNLGVRSVTLISLSAAMLTLMATGGEMTALYVPLLAAAPWLAVVGAGAVAGLAVYAAARLRRRVTRHAAAMSWIVGLGVAMGGACGAGLSLLTVACYLAAIAVMKGDGSGRISARARKEVGDTVARDVHKDGRPLEMEMRRPQRLDPLLNLRRGDGIDGPGLSM